MQERNFGRIESPDARDSLFPVSAVITNIPSNLREKYWWADGWWGNQGSTTMCVAYSWLHYLEDGPVIQDAGDTTRVKPLIPPAKLYKESQLRDPWAGEQYAGTTVRAAAKILKDLGLIKEYRWADNITDVVNTLLTIGPMVVGTKWSGNMSKPDTRGIIKLGGQDMGGHAYLLDGVNLDKKVIRIKNSWGREWGREGFAFISIEDMAKLLSDGGEACVAFERKLTEQLDWSKAAPPGVYTG